LWSRPTRLDLIRQYSDLLVRECTASIQRKSWHRGSRYTLFDHIPQFVFTNQGQVEWIVQWPRGATLTVPAVATGAIAPVESGEVCDLVRQYKLLRSMAAAKQNNRKIGQ